jgi:DNA (cytosine-5)-methyltransferase 1
MKHGSLFSGIGGFDLAAEWMGWENVFHCEWNPFGQKVLKHYWPKAESFNDITKSDFTKYANTIDIISGGFPCQPYSSAGQRKGKEDERHLWPHMLRAIQEISPRYIVGENVRGLLNWNGGMVFNEVCIDLENNGYQVAPVIIPACGVNAPHKRERIWFVASNTRCNERWDLCGQESSEWIGSKAHTRFANDGSNGNVADTSDTGLQGGELNGTFEGRERKCNDTRKSITELYQIANWQQFPTESPICGGDDGIPDRLDNITIPKWRKESLKAYGNAIVPQVALEIFKAIERVDNEML